MLSKMSHVYLVYSIIYIIFHDFGMMTMSLLFYPLSGCWPSVVRRTTGAFLSTAQATRPTCPIANWAMR